METQTTKNLYKGNAKDTQTEKGQKVQPVDNVTVFSTDKLKDIYPKVGTPIEIHSALAEKFIESGKATAEAPKEKESKKDDK